jgi:bifunctional non-homologous end joining protein LigD
VKFDGYRIQAHKHGHNIELLSKNGHGLTGRFPSIAYVLQSLPVKSAVIDGEIVACSFDRTPDFHRLLAKCEEPTDLCLWAFDLLHLNGADLLGKPLKARKAKLQDLVARLDCPAVLYSESFGDALRLLDQCECRQLEGIVSKRIDAPYRSGDKTDWIKVKSQAWREANKERWRLFQKAH